MKDEITIGLNGKTIASFGIDVFKGITPIGIKGVSGFRIDDGVCETGDHILEISISCILEKNYPADYVAKEIEPMIVHPQPETSTPVQKQMDAISTYNEIPIKTIRKPRGPNKPKEEAPEKSVFDKPVEVETVAPVTSTVVSHTPITSSVGGSVLSPTLPPTPVRINELAKLIKMWCKAAQYKIEDVTIEVLNAHGASDIIENDSPETVNAGIKEAARLMKG
jgi:hypothetical protein